MKKSAKKPVIVFGLASAGMGHATRDVPLIQRLNKDYDVHIFCSGQANKWLKTQFKNVHRNHAIKGVAAEGKISLPLILARAALELPKSFFYISRIALFILRHRPAAIISDFEAHSIYAGLLTRKLRKTPIISCDHWTTMRMSEIPFELSAAEQEDLTKWRRTTSMVTPFADRYLVHKVLETKLSSPKARYVPVPVRDSFLRAKITTPETGPVVVSLGHLTPGDTGATLSQSRSQRFIVYGNHEPKIVGNVEYRSFDEDDYIRALQAAPFAIVAANSSAVDAAALGKPFIYCPTPGQFEQKFCGKIFEHLGMAKLVDRLTPEVIDSFSLQLSRYKKAVDDRPFFGNDELCQEIKVAINELN